MQRNRNDFLDRSIEIRKLRFRTIFVQTCIRMCMFLCIYYRFWQKMYAYFRTLYTTYIYMYICIFMHQLLSLTFMRIIQWEGRTNGAWIERWGDIMSRLIYSWLLVLTARNKQFGHSINRRSSFVFILHFIELYHIFVSFF